MAEAQQRIRLLVRAQWHDRGNRGGTSHSSRMSRRCSPASRQRALYLLPSRMQACRHKGHIFHASCPLFGHKVLNQSFTHITLAVTLVQRCYAKSE